MKNAALTTAALLVMVLAAFGLAERSKSSVVMPTTVKIAVPTPVPTPTPTPVVQDTTRGEYIVIGSVARRDQVVTIKTGPEGIVYTVAGKDGKILFNNLSGAQLKEKSPELHDYISTGTGQIWGGLLIPERPDAGIRETR